MSTIYKPQDIHISDVSLATQYKTQINNGYVDAARQIYNNNTQLRGKSMTADMLNQLLEAILALENNYNTNATQFLQNQLDIYQTNINHLTNRGTYSATEQYEIFNYVLYNSDLYFCKGNDGVKPPIGTLPTDTSYWVYLGLHGIVDHTNMGVVYEGAWDSTTTYAALDMVQYNNSLYVAKQASTGQNPATATSYWLLAVEMAPRGITVSATAPSTIQTDDIWFKIL